MRKLALSGLAVGAAMAVGTAQAEPLTLSADQMDQVTAAGSGLVHFDFTLFKDVFANKEEHIFKEVFKNQEVFVQGFFGQADAGANCFDAAAFGCEAITEAFTDVINAEGQWQVTSVSMAEAATSGFSIFVNNGSE